MIKFIFFFMAIYALPGWSHENKINIKIFNLAKTNYISKGFLHLKDPVSFWTKRIDEFEYQFKICSESTCTQETKIKPNHTKEIDLLPTDPKFKPIFDKENNLVNESLSLQIYTSTGEWIKCSSEDEADKHFYPSPQFPLKMKIELGSSIEIYFNGYSNFKKTPVCSLRYRNKEGETKYGMMQAIKIKEFCNHSSENKQHCFQNDKKHCSQEVDHYNGYLPQNFLLLKGLWNENYTHYIAEEIFIHDNFIDKNSFCKEYKESLTIKLKSVLLKQVLDAEDILKTYKDIIYKHSLQASSLKKEMEELEAKFNATPFNPTKGCPALSASIQEDLKKGESIYTSANYFSYLIGFVTQATTLEQINKSIYEAQAYLESLFCVTTNLKTNIEDLSYINHVLQPDH